MTRRRNAERYSAETVTVVVLYSVSVQKKSNNIPMVVIPEFMSDIFLEAGSDL